MFASLDDFPADFAQFSNIVEILTPPFAPCVFKGAEAFSEWLTIHEACYGSAPLRGPVSPLSCPSRYSGTLKSTEIGLQAWRNQSRLCISMDFADFVEISLVFCLQRGGAVPGLRPQSPPCDVAKPSKAIAGSPRSCAPLGASPRGDPNSWVTF